MNLKILLISFVSISSMLAMSACGTRNAQNKQSEEAQSGIKDAIHVSDINFGSSKLNDKPSRKIIINNSSNKAIEKIKVSSNESSSNFTIEDPQRCTTINSGEKCSLEVVFTPKSNTVLSVKETFVISYEIANITETLSFTIAAQLQASGEDADGNNGGSASVVAPVVAPVVPPVVPPIVAPVGPLATAYINSVLYREAFAHRMNLQFLTDVLEPLVGPKETLVSALNKVRNRDYRRLLIPYFYNGRFVLVGIIQHTGYMFYLDPTGQVLPVPVDTDLKAFCNNYLKPKFKIAGVCNVVDYSGTIGQQISVDDDGTVTLRNIRDLIDVPRVTDLDFASAKIVSLTGAMTDLNKAAAFHAAKAQHDAFQAGDAAFRAANQAFSVAQAGSFSNVGLEFAVFHYKTGPLNQAFTIYNRNPANIGGPSEIQGSLDDPRVVDLIPSINVPADTDPGFVAYYNALPYEAFFEGMHTVDRYWATKPPTYPVRGGYAIAGYPQVGCPVTNPNFGDKATCLRRVGGYVFRGEGRTFAQLQVAGEIAPPSLYSGNFDVAHNALTTGGSSAWKKKWVKSWLYASNGTVSMRTPRGHDFRAVINRFPSLNSPDIGGLKVLFDANNTVAGGQWLAGGLQSFRGSFYEYTLLNPYIHTIMSRVKGFISTSKSIVVAKGFAAGMKMAGCGEFDAASDEWRFTGMYAGLSVAQAYTQCMLNKGGWGHTRYIYALYAEGGFDIPQPDLNPWTAVPPKHPYAAFHEHEIPVAGSININKFVGYAETDPTNPGYLKPTFRLSDDLAYDDPGAFERIYKAFDKGM